MRIEGEKADTPDVQPNVIPEVERLQRSDIRMEINGPRKYNSRSNTKRVNHVTTLKIAPNMFKMDAEEKITTHIDTSYLAHTDLKKDKTIV